MGAQWFANITSPNALDPTVPQTRSYAAVASQSNIRTPGTSPPVYSTGVDVAAKRSSIPSHGAPSTDQARKASGETVTKHAPLPSSRPLPEATRLLRTDENTKARSLEANNQGSHEPSRPLPVAANLLGIADEGASSLAVSTARMNIGPSTYSTNPASFIARSAQEDEEQRLLSDVVPDLLKYCDLFERSYSGRSDGAIRASEDDLSRANAIFTIMQVCNAIPLGSKLEFLRTTINSPQLQRSLASSETQDLKRFQKALVKELAQLHPSHPSVYDELGRLYGSRV